MFLVHGSLAQAFFSYVYNIPSLNQQRFNALVRMSDGGYVQAGFGQTNQSGPNAGLIQRTDSLGAVLWTRLYRVPDAPEETDISFFHAAETPDHGLLLTGIIDTLVFSGARGAVFLLKVDLGGQPEWARIGAPVGFGFNDGACGQYIAYRENGDFDIVYSMSSSDNEIGCGVLRMQSDGTIISSHGVLNILSLGQMTNARLGAVCTSMDNGFYVAMKEAPYNGTSGLSGLMLGRYDSLGTLLWWRFYPIEGIGDYTNGSIVMSAKSGGGATVAINDISAHYLLAVDPGGTVLWKRSFATGSPVLALRGSPGDGTLMFQSRMFPEPTGRQVVATMLDSTSGEALWVKFLNLDIATWEPLLSADIVDDQASSRLEISANSYLGNSSLHRLDTAWTWGCHSPAEMLELSVPVLDGTYDLNPGPWTFSWSELPCTAEVIVPAIPVPECMVLGHGDPVVLQDIALRFAPNPVGHVTTITASDGRLLTGSACVITPDGRTAMVAALGKDIARLDVSSLSSGCYMVRLHSHGITFTGRFVKE